MKHQLPVKVGSPELSLYGFLAQNLPHIETSSWDERAAFGGLYINGKRVVTDRVLSFPCIVEYYEPKYSVSEAHNFYPSFSAKWIIYEDEYLAAVFKPAGLPTHPNKEQAHYSLRTFLETHYKRHVHLPSRLDTATAGLVLVSINAQMHDQLQRLFERRLIQKYYLCEVTSPPPDDSIEIDAPIGRSPQHAVLRQISPNDGVEAITRFDHIISNGEKHVLRAKPVTGRTHQIRVHAASFIGPIVGDRFYGGAPSKALHLMSAAARFFHPMKQEFVNVVVSKDLAPAWAKEAVSALS